MKRVLIGFIMDGHAGGIDKYLLNFLEQVHSEDIKIDFLTNKINLELKEDLSKFGCELYEVSTLKHPIKQYKMICNIINQNKYDVSYFNISTAINCIGPLAAKKCNVNLKIIHSHSTANDCTNSLKRSILDIVHNICKTFLYKSADKLLACSKLAGQWLYPKKIFESNRFEVIHNAIDTSKYEYNEKIRIRTRNSLNIGNKHVIGFVGNFCYPKNIFFLLDIFKKICDLRSDCLLMLVGDGPDYEKSIQYAKQLNIYKNILFLGRRNDVNSLMQAMDVFVLPSRFEGLGIVGIEAQASGLKCVFSDLIPKDVKVTKNCTFLSLKSPKINWTSSICNNFDYIRVSQRDNILKNKYDIDSQRQDLRNILILKGM